MENQAMQVRIIQEDNDMTNNENIERKRLKDLGHTNSYIEWQVRMNKDWTELLKEGERENNSAGAIETMIQREIKLNI